MSAPVASVGTAAVTQRIASIRSRFEPARAARPGAADGGAATLDTASAFADLMAAFEQGGAAGVDPAGVSGATFGALAADGDSPGSPGAEAVDRAMAYLGVPYVWGGTDPTVGLDCSGFVQLVYRELGIELPRVSRDQALQGTAVPSIDQARPGDLIAFGSPVDHIAIYVGDGRIVHAPRSGDVVKVTDIHRTPTAIRRIVPDTSSPVPLPGSGGGSAALRDPAVARYSALFAQAGARHGIDPAVLAAVAKVESGGDPNATSSAGARGLMQFMPATARGYGIDPLDPTQAIDGAARMLTEQQRSFGTLELALAAYNAGPGAVRRHGGIPPYPQTQNYVRKVMSIVGGRS